MNTSIINQLTRTYMTAFLDWVSRCSPSSTCRSCWGSWRGSQDPDGHLRTKTLTGWFFHKPKRTLWFFRFFQVVSTFSTKYILFREGFKKKMSNLGFWLKLGGGGVWGGFKSPTGVATFDQGTVVQGDHGPRGQMSKGQLSKEILVQGDFCPMKLFPVISLLQLFFSFSIGYHDIDWL